MPRAIASVDDMLRKLARAWGDVADEEIASETLSFLVDESLDRFASEVLMQREIGVKVRLRMRSCSPRCRARVCARAMLCGRRF